MNLNLQTAEISTKRSACAYYLTLKELHERNGTTFILWWSQESIGDRKYSTMVVFLSGLAPGILGMIQLIGLIKLSCMAN